MYMVKQDVKQEYKIRDVSVHTDNNNNIIKTTTKCVCK